MPFRSDIRQWTTAEALRAHLANYDPRIASWCRGIVLHHTVRPDTTEWRGVRSMQAMQAYYTQLGWQAGPHLFLACHAPNAATNGVWQMTALNETGVHAAGANSFTWGIEVVGNFDAKPWSTPQQALIYDVVVALMQWRGITEVSKRTLMGHREVPSPKSCPGRMIDMDKVRNDIAQRLRGA